MLVFNSFRGAIAWCFFFFKSKFKIEETAYYITYSDIKVVGKYILQCIEYILLFILIIYTLYSFTRDFYTFYIGLLFTHVVTRVNVYLG